MTAPLAGLRVVDMGWLMVGPESARYLGDLGADVIKVESTTRRDPLRSLGPFKDGITGLNRSMSHHTINAGKRSITLDIKHPRGREVLLQLVRWGDILIESFSPGVVESLGMTYDQLSKENPRLIMVSTSLLGQKGPETKGASGTGTIGAAYAGATNLVGWPDRAPTGPHGPWTDAVTPRFVVSSILAALHRRRGSGKGCYIDAAQAECGMQFLMPAYYEFVVNGNVPQRRGAPRSSLRCPSGLFCCAGDDRWIAIDASDDAAWKMLREIIGSPLDDTRFDTLVGRLRAREEIERSITAWTESRSPHSVESTLQKAGVPAHGVHNALDLASDQDLHHQHYYRKLRDSELGEIVIRGPQFSLCKTPHVESRVGPRPGESTAEILASICGVSPEEIARLHSDGVTK